MTSSNAKWGAGNPGSLVDDFTAEGEGLRETLKIEAWPRLSRETNWLRPKTVCVLAGPPGRGKSLFLLEALIRLHVDKVPWYLLPLEDTAADVYRRVLAVLSEDWSMLDTDQRGADRRIEKTGEYLEIMSDMQKSIFENPRLPIGEKGKEEVPPLPYHEVLKWIKGAAQKARVVAVDPLAQIDWVGAKPWEAQADFMRKVTGMAASTASTIILIAHLQKRPGKSGLIQPTEEDVQGAAEIARLAHTVLLWDGHPDKQSNVWKPGEAPGPVIHNRTMIVGKVRNAPGMGVSIAFCTNSRGPGYEELGTIAPKKEGGS